MDIHELTIDKLMSGKKVKVLDGIAGAAKTSALINLFLKNRVKYIHTTSTNKLKRDIEDRFGTSAYTVAGKLFKTDNGIFYNTQKEVNENIIIIDEILQTSPRIYEWIKMHKENKRIFVCTDRKQMLAPKTGESNLKKFTELCNDQDVDYYNFDYSYRPVNDETREIYNDAYSKESWASEYYKYIFEHCEVLLKNEIEYDSNNAFLCHSNDIESEMYDEYELRSNYNNDLIPKGMIANKEVKDAAKYPIMPQSETVGKDNLKYWQVSNVGSVVRYQGSEVPDGHILYYCINPHSVPNNRELYTAITRAKNFDNFKIVLWKAQKDIKLFTFNGKPIVQKSFVFVDKNHDYSLGKDENGNSIKASEKDNLNYADIAAIKKEAQKQNNTTYYAGVIKDGAVVNPDKKEKIKNNKLSAMGLIRKEPRLALKYPGLFYREIDKYNERPMTGLAINGSHKDKPISEYKYGIDLYSSYIHCWYNGKMIDCTTYTPEQNKECKIYLIHKSLSSLFQDGHILTQPLVDYLKKHNCMGLEKYVCIGSCDYIKNDKIAEMLIQKAHKSVEDKQETKGIHWGLFQREYLQGVNLHGTIGVEAYVINQQNLYNLMMYHILSTEILVMLQIRYVIDNGSWDFAINTHPHVDCLYFNTHDDIKELGDKIAAAIPGYYFRIFENDINKKKTSEQVILYQNYDNLKTRAEIRKEKDREYRKNKRRNDKDI